MRLIKGGIILSRRNLLSLLHKLDKPGSARCLVDGRSGFCVIVEKDPIHYQGRTPGEMTPDTEEFVKAHGGVGR